MKRIILGALAATCAALAPASAHAAPIRECVTHMGGLYVNLTTRNVACGTARTVADAVLGHMPRGCYDSYHRPACYFRIRSGGAVWDGHPYWFTRYGLTQLDVRVTTSRGRVVHWQTDWDGE